MTPRIMTSAPFLPEAEFTVLKGQVAALSHTPRGAAATDAEEAWLGSPGAWAARMDALALAYGASHLGAKADEVSSILSTRYVVGKSSPEHTDQYVRSGSSTMHRTVSAILVIEAAEEGGEVVVRNPGKTMTFELPLRENELLLFPADCWHEILPVVKGLRRSIVRWYADSTGAPFSSE
ncbi:MAG: 2OG-Fe(II) oxygenase [Rhodococcus sp.]|nr:2OG-Fe(II) oxygenase [Rhodococcus sp. (in: high G+C Gram-positive bacteria)]